MRLHGIPMAGLILSGLISCITPAHAEPAFSISSTDMVNQKPLSIQQVFNKSGCNGGNLSPQISWQHAPTGSKSFAITLYDPDSPVGSGWWHWIAFDIPSTTNGLPTGAGNSTDKMPIGSIQARNDFGENNYGGPCPPAGDKPHHYILTVWALDTDKLPVSMPSTADQISLTLNSHKLAKASLISTYQRTK